MSCLELYFSVVGNNIRKATILLHGNAPCQETFIKLKYMRSFKFFTDRVGFLRRS